MKYKETVDLTKYNEDYSVFLPSISGFYAKTLGLDNVRIPSGMEYGLDGFNFLNEEDSYFHYKWGLYSAGHAHLDTAKSDQAEAMIQGRDRNKTFMLGDSGGFQIMTGVLKCDWNNFKTDDSLRIAILDWLEHTADYSMVLDVPTLAITPSYTEKTGLTTFDECLDYTKFNNDWMVKHRKGNTKFLNSMQGRSWPEAEYWYEQTKHYPFEGFGFGGSTTRDLNILLRLLVKMRDDKLLEQDEHDHLHFLGMSRPEWAVYFTAIKRLLRQSVNPNLEITYDAASAFICAAKGQMFTYPTLDSRKFGFKIEKAIDDKMLSDIDRPIPWSSPILDRMLISDLCNHTHGVPDIAQIEADDLSVDEVFNDPKLLNDERYWVESGSKTKTNKVPKTSWDIFSYLAAMGHNVYQTIRTLQAANAQADVALATNTVDYKDVLAVSMKKTRLDIDAFIPSDILITTRIIEDALTSETPFDVIDNAQNFLQRSKVLKTSSDDTTFNKLFE